MDYLGHSVSQEFTFTAHGTNGQQIAATFLLTNNAANIGTAVFGYTLGSWTATFSNTAPIIINDYAPATPYPSVINVSGLSGTLVKTTLTWTNVSHTSPADIDALLVSPGLNDTLIMAHAGGEDAITHVTLTFSDATNNSHLSHYGQITNGVYQPTDYCRCPVSPDARCATSIQPLQIPGPGKSEATPPLRFFMRKTLLTIGMGLAVSSATIFTSVAAEPGMKTLPGHVPAAVARLQANGQMAVRRN